MDKDWTQFQSTGIHEKHLPSWRLVERGTGFASHAVLYETWLQSQQAKKTHSDAQWWTTEPQKGQTPPVTHSRYFMFQ